MIFIWIKFVAFVYFIENSIKVTKSINDQSKIKFYLKDKPNYLLLFINSKVYEICTIFHKFYREKLFFILQKWPNFSVLKMFIEQFFLKYLTNLHEKYIIFQDKNSVLYNILHYIIIYFRKKRDQTQKNKIKKSNKILHYKIR